MFLKSLNLQHFRNFAKKGLEFKSLTTLLVGPNAIGKTNLLEAIYLLATGKSFHASREEEMIDYGQEIARVEGVVVERAEVNTNFCSVHELASLRTTTDTHKNCVSPRAQREIDFINLEIILTRGEVGEKRTAKKLYRANGVPKRWHDFSGVLKCVLFRPEDIDLILGSPSLRRDFLDAVLCQVDWQYRVCLHAYKKGLRQRNKLLERIREAQAQVSQLTFWNQLLIKNGQIVTEKRQQLIDFFNDFLKTKLEIVYDHSTITLARLEKYAQAEIALGVTLVGPHRDDIKLKVNPPAGGEKLKVGRDLALYGSRGEQRMAVLRLKMAELEFIRTKTGEQPVLLLDDIFSELDKDNRKLVLKIINSSQVIITSTEADIVSLDKAEVKTL